MNSVVSSPINTEMGLEGVINSDRYVVNSFIAKGTWGRVYKARDKELKTDVAIKVLNPTPMALEQMRHRNLTEERVIKNEALELTACSHVVPRLFAVDKDGKPFIVMPFYKKFLSNALDDEMQIVPPRNDLYQEFAIRYMRDISLGLGELHTKLNRVHGDLKPDNLAQDEKGNILVNDLGTSTCASMGWSTSPRDNMGFVLTRAPECFAKDNQKLSHPTKESDVWSYGALAYRLFTGNYPLEREFDGADPNKVINDLGIDGGNKLIKQKVRNLPQKFRKYLSTCLNFSPYHRFHDGIHANQALQEILDNTNSAAILKKSLLRVAYITIPSALVGLGLYTGMVHEPQDLTMPQIKMEGYLSVDDTLLPQGEKIIFDKENLPNLPVPTLLRAGHQGEMRKATNNKYAAYLLKTYVQTFEDIRRAFEIPFVINVQHDTWSGYSTDAEKQVRGMYNGTLNVIARNIEVALTQSKTPKGTVDLEDVCAISRIGVEKVNEARRASNSFDFKEYIQAKDRYGKRIINERDEEFIKMWLSYINANL